MVTDQRQDDQTPAGQPGALPPPSWQQVQPPAQQSWGQPPTQQSWIQKGLAKRRQKMIDGATPLLPPGTQIRQILEATNRSPLFSLVLLTNFFLPGPGLLLYFILFKRRVLAVTDDAIYVLDSKRVLAVAPRHTRLGLFSGPYAKVAVGEINLHLKPKLDGDQILAADAWGQSQVGQGSVQGSAVTTPSTLPSVVPVSPGAPPVSAGPSSTPREHGSGAEVVRPMGNQPSPKAQQALAAVLEPGEEVRVWACGRYGSVAIVTDRRLHVYKCEPLTRPKMTSWPLGEVTGLSLHKGHPPFMAVDLLGDSNMPKSTSPNAMAVASVGRYEEAEQAIRALRRAIAPAPAAVTTSGVDAGPVGEELAMLTQAWTLPAIIRTYERDDAGRRLLAAEVQVLGQHGYSPAGQDEGDGHHEAGRILLKGTTTVLFGVVGGMMVGTKSKGTITVAFLKTQVPPPAPAPADPMEQVRKLGELRDAGVLTPAEFETKKAELLSRL